MIKYHHQTTLSIFMIMSTHFIPQHLVIIIQTSSYHCTNPILYYLIITSTPCGWSLPSTSSWSPSPPPLLTSWRSRSRSRSWWGWRWRWWWPAWLGWESPWVFRSGTLCHEHEIWLLLACCYKPPGLQLYNLVLVVIGFKWKPLCELSAHNGTN